MSLVPIWIAGLYYEMDGDAICSVSQVGRIGVHIV